MLCTLRSSSSSPTCPSAASLAHTNTRLATRTLAQSVNRAITDLAGTAFVRWPGRGLLRGQLQRLVEWGQHTIRGAHGGGGGSGSGWALLWHLLISSGAVHQSLLALALPLSFKTHLAVTVGCVCVSVPRSCSYKLSPDLVGAHDIKGKHASGCTRTLHTPLPVIP